MQEHGALPSAAVEPEERALNKWLGSGLALAMGMATQAHAQATDVPPELQQLDATVERVRQHIAAREE